MFRNTAALCTGFLLVIIFFWQNIFSPAVNITPTVGTNDFTDLNYPLRHFFIESIKKGQLPLWASGISSGYPILAEGQIGALYPLNLFFALFDMQTSVNLTIVSSYFLIFFFSFLYFRKIGITLFSAFFGATLVTFSGFAATQLMHFGMLISFYLFLAQLWCLENLLQKQKIIWVILMGILFGLSILGGHPQIIIYSLIFLFPYWFFFWILRKRSIIQFSVLCFMFLVIGVGIGAGQIFPQYELTKFSQRSEGLPDKDIFRFQFPIGRIVNFALPFWGRDMSNTVEAFQMNGWPDDERYVYMGVIGFGLLVISIFRLGRLGPARLASQPASQAERPARFESRSESGGGGQGESVAGGGLGKYGIAFLVTIIISLLISFGDQTPFGFVLHIPPFSFFRLPFRIFFLLNFVAGGLVAIGVQTLLFRHSGNPAKPGARRYLAKPEHPESLRERSWSPPRFALSPQDDRRKSLFRFVVFSLLLLVLFFDLFYNAEKLHPAVEAKLWYKTPKTVEFLMKSLKQEERVTAQYYYYPSAKVFLEHPEIWQDPKTLIHLRNLLPAFNNLLYDIPLNIGAGNAAGLYVNRYRELEDEVFFKGLQYKGLSVTNATSSFAFLNRLMGVRYELIASDIKSRGLTQVFHAGKNGQPDIFLYELTDPLPRAFVVQKAEQASSGSIKNHLLKGDFNPREKIYIQEKIEGENIGNFSSTAVIKKYQDTQVMIQTNASSAGFLFLSDTYYPGWKAYVDNKETKIYRANYAFRAVEVPQGNHMVLFRYKPASLYYGVTISLGTLAISSLCLAALLFFDVRKKRQ